MDIQNWKILQIQNRLFFVFPLILDFVPAPKYKIQAQPLLPVIDNPKFIFEIVNSGKRREIQKRLKFIRKSTGNI